MMENTKNNLKQTENIGEIHRDFKPTYLALKNKTTIFILSVLLVLFGFFSYKSMPRELFPEIVIPTIMVTTPYPGNSPSDIENLITRPIEKELKGLKNVKNLSSSSFQDFSLIAVEFETNVPVKQALQEVKDKVDKAKSELPDDLDNDPNVEDIDLSEFPIMTINLSGDYSLAELQRYAEKLQDELEALKEVSEADIQGIDEREIQIEVNPHEMEARDITFEDIEAAMLFENVTMGAGELITDRTRRSIRTEADYLNMSQIRNTIIKAEEGNIIYLNDIAEVTDGFKDRTSISRLEGDPVISLAIIKKSGANILEATDNIYQIIDHSKKNGMLPKGLKVVITDDNSQYVRDQIANLENSIILGMIFVIFVLYLFLGARNAMFSGLAIPMSMCISFVILRQMDYTLNNMILFSLILALGMLVDNAIVVVENVYRLFSDGNTKMLATKKGVSEIAYPIISSTATTLAAFFPLVFWEGIMGEFMKYLPITLIIVLTSSLFVALVLNPVYTSSFLKIDNYKEGKSWKKILVYSMVFIIFSVPFYLFKSFFFANILVTIAFLILFNHFAMRPMAHYFQEIVLIRIENSYERLLNFALKGWNPYFFFAGTFLLLFLSIGFYNSRNLKVLFFPDNEPQSIYVILELPIGTDLEKTDSVSLKVENIINETLEPYRKIVKSVGTTVGRGKIDLFSASNPPQKSLTTISFVDFQYRTSFNTSKIMQELTDRFKTFTGGKIYIEKNEMGPPVGNPINIEIAGADFQNLIEISSEVQNMIEEDMIAGIDGLQLDLNPRKPEMRIHVDREKVRRFGMSTQQIAYALRTSLYGRKVGKFKDGEDEYDMMLRLQNPYRSNVSSLMNQRILVSGNGNGGDKKIPISSVADFSYGSTYDKINRKDRERVVTLFSQIKEGYNANEINDRIREVISTYDIPKGYSIALTGEQEEQAETQEFLSQALLVALSIIILILVTQFNSFIRPVIIIITVLLSTIGVLLGLATFKMEFVILMTGIGIISLAGIVVNNGIVLVDFIDLLRKRRKEELHLEQKTFLTPDEQIGLISLAGKTRLRPVLLTAITTILGLIPLAMGINIDFYGLYSSFDPNFYTGGESTAFWGPMAWTVIFGLTFATFLTLIITPVMYLITIKVNHQVRIWMRQR